ncbi:MAG: single-stranded DNA-binding protein [Bacteroidales bacterium]|nr:single-stranded DNA-binding protein [Bacteroidales bacterium]
MLLKVFATNVVISKGYDNAPAIRYSEKGDSVRFRIGAKQYDTRAENNTRWVNISVKAFGHICERIRKMDLKEGSYINLVGRLDEDSWTDQKTGETRSAMVIILDDVEFASGSGKTKGADHQQPAQQNGYASVPAPAVPPEASSNFTGYEPFGGESLFDMN